MAEPTTGRQSDPREEPDGGTAGYRRSVERCAYVDGVSGLRIVALRRDSLLLAPPGTVLAERSAV